jgi:glucose-6-phosphate isomerase
MPLRITSQRPVDRGSSLYQSLRAAVPRLAAKDYTLWGKEAEAESAIRLNWVDLPRTSQDLSPELEQLQSWLSANELKTLILCGMGGSSLGPEVLAKTFQKKLTVLDTTDPDQIQTAIPTTLDDVAVIIGSKSGSTAETASQKVLLEKLFRDAGLEPRDHCVIVTDPGSPFDISSRGDGYFVINADPNVGGRFSVLSAFGMVPAAAMGIDYISILTSAHSAAATFTGAESPAVDLAVLILESQRQNIAFTDSASAVPGISDWIEQLIAESTGKEGKGLLPIAIESSQSPIAGDSLLISFNPHDSHADIIVEGELGELFILWEWVTALIGIALEINPFDQPNVQDAKVRAIALLDTWQNVVPHFEPAFENNNLQVFSSSQATTLDGQLRDFLDQPSGYIAIMAYLARGEDDAIVALRSSIAMRTGRATTFGWGPRFLHSTGQYHKGGIPNGAFLSITGENKTDIDIPGKDFSFHTLLMAQALGDAQALSEKKFPLTRIHLKNRKAGIDELLQAIAAMRK